MDARHLLHLSSPSLDRAVCSRRRLRVSSLPRRTSGALLPFRRHVGQEDGRGASARDSRLLPARGRNVSQREFLLDFEQGACVTYRSRKQDRFLQPALPSSARQASSCVQWRDQANLRGCCVNIEVVSNSCSFYHRAWTKTMVAIRGPRRPATPPESATYTRTSPDKTAYGSLPLNSSHSREEDARILRFPWTRRDPPNNLNVVTEVYGACHPNVLAISRPRWPATSTPRAKLCNRLSNLRQLASGDKSR